jgi:hypothetical protein
VIEISNQRWKFSEYLTDDGVGTITTWLQGLDVDVQARIDAHLLQWASRDKWTDAYVGKFESLKGLREIAVLHERSVYRILGSAISIWEFVMLIGHTDDLRRNNIPREIKAEANLRLNALRMNPERRREFED